MLLLLPHAASAQREAYTWYFGQGIGLDFHHSPAKLLKDGKINTSEGCATVSDGAGNLLFYTEGDTVWNRNHKVMPHGTGLKGHFSSTHNVLAVPKPGDASTYYLFTVDHSGYFYTWPNADMSHYKGLNYSELNMCLDGGLGDVVESTKNKRLPGYLYSEKLTATRLADGSGYWVLTYLMSNGAKDTDAFRAYRVTTQGVDSLPVTSRGSFYYNDFRGGNGGLDPEMGIGQMKFSPDGRKLAVVVYVHNKVELYDFDAATGKVSNPVTLYKPDPWKSWPSVDVLDRGYGLEFSPDGSKLYASFNRGVVFQYDLSNPAPAAMLASRTLIVDFPMRYYESLGGLQLGPDGRIYLPHTSERMNGSSISDYYLDVIEQPNRKGTACGYKTNAYPILAGSYKSTGRPGVPNVLPELLNFEPNEIVAFTHPSLWLTTQANKIFRSKLAGDAPDSRMISKSSFLGPVRSFILSHLYILLYSM